MDLFYEDGHVNEKALQSLIDGELDEMGRLEISEHLSFCDECLMKYSDMLSFNSNEPLDYGETAQRIMPVVKKRLMRERLYKYSTMAVAACLAITFWITGVFNIDTSEVKPPDVGSHTRKITEWVSKFTHDVTNGIGGFFDQIQERDFKNGEE